MLPDFEEDIRIGDAANDLVSIKPLEARSRLSDVLDRTHLAYYSLIVTHARLMLDTMTREGISQFLTGEYLFSLPDDVIEDLKHALNTESAERESFKSRFK